jgi:2'-5' RNA ligase
MSNDPLIVTAKMDADSSDFFNELRQKHFPAERNFLAAHITLFHHLPGDKLDEIEDVLKVVASRQYEFPIIFPLVRFLGRGTAVEVESTELVSLRIKLSNKWSEYLTDQDKKKFRPHVTIQNKVEPEEAQLLFEGTKANWEMKRGKAVGLQLWHYRGGSWQIANEFDFYKTEDY